MGAIDSTTRSDLLETIDDRAGSNATMITNPLPVEHWHAWIGDATIADAILDRRHAAHHRLTLTGDSLRTERPKTAGRRKHRPIVTAALQFNRATSAHAQRSRKAGMSVDVHRNTQVMVRGLKE